MDEAQTQTVTDRGPIYVATDALQPGDVINVAAGDHEGSTATTQGIEVFCTGSREYEQLSPEEYAERKGERVELRSDDADDVLRSVGLAYNDRNGYFVDTGAEHSILTSWVPSYPDTDDPLTDDNGRVYHREAINTGADEAKRMFAKGPRGALYMFERAKGKLAMRSLRAKNGILGYVQSMTLPEERADRAHELAAERKRRREERARRGVEARAGEGPKFIVTLQDDDEDTLVFTPSTSKGQAHVAGEFSHVANGVEYTHLGLENDYEATVKTGATDALKETDRSITHWGFDGSSKTWHFEAGGASTKQALRALLSAETDLDSISIDAELAEQYVVGLTEAIEHRDETDDDEDDEDVPEAVREAEAAPDTDEYGNDLSELPETRSVTVENEADAREGATHISHYRELADETGEEYDLAGLVEMLADERGMFPVDDDGDVVPVEGTRFADDETDDADDEDAPRLPYNDRPNPDVSEAERNGRAATRDLERAALEGDEDDEDGDDAPRVGAREDPVTDGGHTGAVIVLKYFEAGAYERSLGDSSGYVMHTKPAPDARPSAVTYFDEWELNDSGLLLSEEGVDVGYLSALQHDHLGAAVILLEQQEDVVLEV